MIDLDAIKRNANILTVLSVYGIYPDAKGFINCIVHREKTASMKVYERTNTLYCYGCHVKLDVLDLVMEMEHCTLYEAAARVDAICGLNFCGKKSAKELADIKKKQREIVQKRIQEQYEAKRSKREWIGLCNQLHFAEKEYAKLVPATNTPEFEKFSNDPIQVDKALTFAFIIKDITSDLDKIQSEW